MSESNSNAIETSKLGRDFGSKKVLQDVSFAIPAGNVCALLGKNGVGKTTLLKLLMGLIQATEGTSCLLGDQDWPRAASTLRRTGCLLDGFEPPKATQIRHLLDLGRATGTEFDESSARKLLKERGLEPRCRWSTLSKGQRRWVLLTLLLCRKCDVLLLDEPADGLDPQSRIELYQLIRQQANDRNVTALIATHVITDIERVADQVCILHDKSILFQADLEDLREQVQVIDFDASPPLTQLPAGVERLHVVNGGSVQWWLRDRTDALESARFENEIRRRKASLEELFIALTGNSQIAGLPPPLVLSNISSGS
ncbi:MAG: ytrB 1 [Planctomycetaceae bacterium]|nr:ytrB 1 [Planctomycetaceae bacterium]